MDLQDGRYELALRFLNGECSREEELMIQEWQEADPDHREFFRLLVRLRDGRVAKRRDWDARESWRVFEQRHLSDSPGEMGAYRSDSGSPAEGHLYGSPAEEHLSGSPAEDRVSGSAAARQKRQAGAGSVRHKVWLVAASLLLLFTGTVYLYSIHQPAGDEVAEVVMREVVTNRGQRTMFHLNDGSRITLNSSGRMVIPEHLYPGEPVEVFLEGEAYFEVSSDPGRTFTVRTSESVTQVLGTSFLVSSWPAEEEVVVAVSEGEVAFGSAGTSLEERDLLVADQQGVLSEGGQVTISDIPDRASWFGWTEGLLVFRDEDLEEVMERLERWFNIDFSLGGDLRVDEVPRLTATFTERQPLDEVLEAVTLSLQIEYSAMAGEDGRVRAYRFTN